MASWLARLGLFELGVERLDGARERLALAVARARERLRGMVHELVGEPLGERLEDGARRLALGEARARLAELDLAVLIGAPAQLHDRRRRGARRARVAEFEHVALHDRLGIGGAGAGVLRAFLSAVAVAAEGGGE